MERALLKLILLSLAIGFSLSDRECRARNAFFNPETSRCYLFLRGVWLNEAQEKCKENGYELISIENQTMNDFVLGLSRNHLKNNNVTGRVGIHYKGIPKWHHRKKVYHNFDENQGYVIHAQYIKHLCTVMNISTGLWYQIDCYKRYCENHVIFTLFGILLKILKKKFSKNLMLNSSTDELTNNLSFKTKNIGGRLHCLSLNV
ncbi:hypothetical protein Y032_0082g1598 [Ancylostoma ceylanicum]|nr:hypothetical protein Y032_0082g1598 [Ancylostoma ceylanicum]